MNRLLFILFFITCIPCCKTIGYTVSYEKKSFTEKSFDSASVYYEEKNIPQKVRNVFKKVSGFKMKLSDSSNFKRIKKRRGEEIRKLLFYVAADGFSIVYYLHLGRGNHNHCLFFHEYGRGYLSVTSVRLNPKVKSYEDLKESLVSGNYQLTERSWCRF